MIAEKALAPGASWHDANAGDHVVQFYEDDAFLVGSVAAYIGSALRVGGAGVVVATAQHRAGVEAAMAVDGLDVEMAIAEGRYVPLDAAELLGRIVVDGVPDRARFREWIAPAIVAAGAGARPVYAFGEMVALLVAAGNPPAALALETFWNELQAELDFSLFCAYPIGALGGEAMAAVFAGVCQAHHRVIPTESYTGLAEREARLREISALQQRAQSLETALAAERRARQEAEAALRVRDEFLSIAAHELRTPLTSLLGNAQLVLRRLPRDGAVQSARLAPGVAEIADQARRLNLLVGHLLDLSRLDGGQLALERHPTELATLVRRVVESARRWGDHHTISLAAPGELWTLLDPLRFEQVLANLLDNAIKYSPDGGEVEVRLEGGGRAVELSVRDHGLGIPAQKRGRIFERFFQAHGNGHRGGLGLGLYVSRQIVELHGGTIRAEFPDDGGTRFVVTLPL